MSFYVVQFLTGLASAASLFLVASGLSIIFGVSRVVNFAHGSFFMLGAYIAYSLVGAFDGGILGFWGGIVGAALAVGLIGVVVEVLLLRRLYHSPELFQLVGTFGVVLVVQDVALSIWGPDDLLGPRAPGLDGAVDFLGHRLPEYDIALIILGPLVLVAIWLLLNRTRWGVLVRAATQDPEMAGALGINQKWLLTGVFFLGSVLAGLGGALQLPREPANLLMDFNIIAEVFVVVVIGGMGNIFGAFLAAVLISELQAFGILIFPEITLVLVFLVMAVVLVIRPWGLLGKAEIPHIAARAVGRPFRPVERRWAHLGLAVLAVLAVLPTFAGDYALQVASEVIIFALFAASLNFIMGVGGMISFGHAAYLGFGAYGAALLVRHLGFGMEAALIAAPVMSALGAAVFGWFCVRLSGVYLAMLTLAFAQIAWSIVFQWYDFTGGDNGILGIWPAPWASDSWIYYYVTLGLGLGGLWALRQCVFAPFGFTLRATRDSAARAEAIGIDVKRHQWQGFIVAGAAAGLAGGLYAFLKGSVFPTVMSIPISVDGLVMVLLGGVQTLMGPVVGAAVFTGLKIGLAGETNYWRIILGAVIIASVVAFPQGIVGFVKARTGRGEA
ncbi:MAG: ABC transporter permease [Rhodospirillales bacterium]|nr:ABC transporter permease [Rhodospirillales bacterium]